MSIPPLDINSLTVEQADPISPEMAAAADEQEEIEQLGKRKGWRDYVGIDPTRERPRKPLKERKPPPAKPRPGTLVRPLTELYGAMGMLVMPFDQPCGTAILANAEQCAKSMDQLARENPAARRVIMALVETSVWGAVIAAHAPVAMAIAAHHIPAVRSADIPISSIPTQSANGHA